MKSVIYKGERIWKGGKKFTQYKIRTLKEHDGSDREVIPWRAFIRKYWLDEIPQIVNLLLGEIWVFWVRPHREKQLKAKKQHVQDMYVSDKPGFVWAHGISHYLGEEYESDKHDEIYMRLRRRMREKWIGKRVSFNCFLVYHTAMQVLGWHETIEK